MNQDGTTTELAVDEVGFFLEQEPRRQVEVQLLRGRVNEDGWTVTLPVPGLGAVRYGLLECHPLREVMALVDMVSPGEIALWLPLPGVLQKWIGYGHALGREDLSGAPLRSLGEVAEWSPIRAGDGLILGMYYVRDAAGVCDIIWSDGPEQIGQCVRRSDMGPVVQYARAEEDSPLSLDLCQKPDGLSPCVCSVLVLSGATQPCAECEAEVAAARAMIGWRPVACSTWWAHPFLSVDQRALILDHCPAWSDVADASDGSI